MGIQWFFFGPNLFDCKYYPTLPYWTGNNKTYRTENEKKLRKITKMLIYEAQTVGIRKKRKKYVGELSF